MDLASLAAGLVVGIVLGALAARLRAAAGERDAAAQVAAAEARAEVARSERARAENTLDVEREARATAERERAETAARAEETKKNAEELQGFVDKAREDFQNAFAELSRHALANNTQSFLDLARESFKASAEKASGDLEVRKKEIEGLVKPLQESLVKLEGAHKDLEGKREGAYGALREQIQGLLVQSQSLQKQAVELATALRGSSQARGRWGEVQLRNIVELAGMVEHCDFVEQEAAGEGRPDVIVELPGARRIAIDAKAPLSAYLDAAAAADEAARAEALARHAAALRAHVKTLSSRAYQDALGAGVDFVVLFLPGDSFLAASFESDPDLWDRAIRDKVLLATPVTLIALLRTCALYWQQNALAANAREIGEAAGDLYQRVANFVEPIQKIGKELGSAVEAYNQAVGSYTGRILPYAQRVKQLGGAEQAKKEVVELAPVEARLRELPPRP